MPVPIHIFTMPLQYWPRAASLEVFYVIRKAILHPLEAFKTKETLFCCDSSLWHDRACVCFLIPSWKIKSCQAVKRWIFPSQRRGLTSYWHEPQIYMTSVEAKGSPFLRLGMIVGAHLLLDRLAIFILSILWTSAVWSLHVLAHLYHALSIGQIVHGAHFNRSFKTLMLHQ